MRLISLLLILVFSFGISACSSQQKDEAAVETGKSEVITEVKKVGEPVTVQEVTPLATLLENPLEYVGKTLLIEGHVEGRCAGSGCWVSLACDDSGKVFYVKSIDHSFVFPEECVNRDIRAQGILMKMEQKDHDKEHEKEHEKEHAEGEVEGEHKCPDPVYYLNPVGVEIMPEEKDASK